MEVMETEVVENVVDLDTNDNQLRRSRLVVDQKLHDAKLESTNFLPTAQCIFFDDDLDNDGVRLLELDGDLLKDLEAGEAVTVKGEDDENCVLVTDEKTYELRSAETSNLLLVARDFVTKDRLKADQDDATGLYGSVEFPLVRAMFSEYLETRPIKPKLQKLRTLLEENPYRGAVEEKDETRGGRKFAKRELVEKVQSSRVEIETELVRLNALEIDGYWRLLDSDYFNSVLGHVLNLIDENSWPLDAVPVEEVLAVLKELEPEEVILNVLETIGEERKPANDDDGDTDSRLLFRIDQMKVAVNFAQVILQKAGRFHLDDFMSVWSCSLPENFDKPNAEMLRGMALVDAKSVPPSVSYFPKADLPEDAASRFDFLFRTREKWTREDIEPYLADLTTAKLDVGAILMRHARSSTVNGVKYFSSRKTMTSRR